MPTERGRPRNPGFPAQKTLNCSAIDNGITANQRAAFPLINERFQVTDERFTLDVSSWPVENRDFGRLADRAMVPDDIALPERDDIEPP